MIEQNLKPKEDKNGLCGHIDEDADKMVEALKKHYEEKSQK